MLNYLNNKTKFKFFNNRGDLNHQPGLDTILFKKKLMIKIFNRIFIRSYRKYSKFNLELTTDLQ